MYHSDVPPKLPDFYVLYRAAQTTVDSGSIFAKATAKWIIASFSSTLVTNMMTSGKSSTSAMCITNQIWRTECSVSSKRASVHGPVLMPILVHAYGCRCSVLSSALHHAHLFCSLEQRKGSCFRLRDFAFCASYRKALTCDQLGHTNHHDCLLHSACSCCNQSTRQQLLLRVDHS